MAEPRRSGRARKPVLNTFEADAPPPEIKPKASKRKPAAKKGKTAINEPPPGGQFPPITAAEDHPVDPDEALVLFNIPDAGSSTEVADSKPKAPTKKRGRPAANKTAEGSSKAGGEDGETVKPKKKGRTKKVDPNAERNARVEASACPPKMFQKFKKAIGQRMFMVDRIKVNDVQEDFKILGSTGNVYTTRISTQPRCDCPDYLFNGRTICKHTIFVLIRVLKVPDESHIWYSARLTDAEVQGVFASAPANPQDSAADPTLRKAWRVANGLEEPDEESEVKIIAGTEEEGLEKRKMAIGEDCPVCYEEITAEEAEGENLVFDQAVNGCGKPLHKQCFDMWAKTATSKGLPVTCVWCRADWPVPGGVSGSQSAYGKARIPGQTYAAMGYLNMAEAAGMQKPGGASTYR